MSKTLDMIRKSLIKNGVMNLRAFGYPGCNEENILTDMIFKAFFERMLEENKGVRLDIDHEIDKLLKELRADGTDN